MPQFGLTFLLMLAKALAESDPETVFEKVGDELETGYCFAADYAALYRKYADGQKQLLGNTSNPRATPEAYKTRINIKGIYEVRVLNLTPSDSGMYLIECWSDNAIVTHHALNLFVCEEKIKAREIVLDPEADTNLKCDSSHDNVTVKWFSMQTSDDKAQLFLDTEMSQEPLQEKFKGLLQVKDNGHSLLVSNHMLQNVDRFYCLVMQGKQCKSFQELHMPDYHLPVYHGVGDKVTLPCSSAKLRLNQSYWETPLGNVDTNTSRKSGSMYVETKNYSLVIPSITLDHSGMYSCLSSLILKKYLIIVCSKMESFQNKTISGSPLTLDCGAHQNKLDNIKWFRQTGNNAIEQIYDSDDPTVNPPADLAHRMQIEKKTSLQISKINANESGTYWCVVSVVPENPILEEEFTDYDEQGDIAEDKCDLKRVFQLMVQSNDRAESNSSLRKYIIVGVGVGIVILILIGIVAILKLRSKTNCKNIGIEEPRQTELSSPLVSLKGA